MKNFQTLNESTLDFLRDYGETDSMYLCDAISEFADGRVSVYYSDIKKFISENVDAVNDAVAEFGWDGCGSDLMKAGQMAEYVKIKNEVSSDLADYDQNFTIGDLKKECEEFAELVDFASVQ